TDCRFTAAFCLRHTDLTSPASLSGTMADASTNQADGSAGKAEPIRVHPSTLKFIQWQGMMIPNVGTDPEVQFQKVKDMKLRDSDVILCSYPKCAPYRNYYYFLDQVAEFEKNNPGVPIFHISYEELKLNTVETLGKLAAYLGVDASSQLLQDIAAAVSFKKQKEEEAKLGDPSKKNLRFFRK
ncbi:hypothetical protein BaRGS_00035707, partial [Batillaria attramentaria]